MGLISLSSTRRVEAQLKYNGPAGFGGAGVRNDAGDIVGVGVDVIGSVSASGAIRGTSMTIDFTANAQDLNATESIASGTAVPIYAFVIVRENTTLASFNVFGYSLAVSPFVALSYGRGTSASPEAILNNDGIGSFYFQGCDPTRVNSAAIIAQATQNWGVTKHGSRMTFSVTPKDSATLQKVLLLNSNGLSIGLTAPRPATAALYVQGDSWTSGDWYTDSSRETKQDIVEATQETLDAATQLLRAAPIQTWKKKPLPVRRRADFQEHMVADKLITSEEQLEAYNQYKREMDARHTERNVGVILDDLPESQLFYDDGVRRRLAHGATIQFLLTVCSAQQKAIDDLTQRVLELER